MYVSYSHYQYIHISTPYVHMHFSGVLFISNFNPSLLSLALSLQLKIVFPVYREIFECEQIAFMNK